MFERFSITEQARLTVSIYVRVLTSRESTSWDPIVFHVRALLGEVKNIDRPFCTIQLPNEG